LNLPRQKTHKQVYLLRKISKYYCWFQQYLRRRVLDKSDFH